MSRNSRRSLSPFGRRNRSTLRRSNSETNIFTKEISSIHSNDKCTNKSSMRSMFSIILSPSTRKKKNGKDAIIGQDRQRKSSHQLHSMHHYNDVDLTQTETDFTYTPFDDIITESLPKNPVPIKKGKARKSSHLALIKNEHKRGRQLSRSSDKNFTSQATLQHKSRDIERQQVKQLRDAALLGTRSKERTNTANEQKKATKKITGEQDKTNTGFVSPIDKKNKKKRKSEKKKSKKNVTFAEIEVRKYAMILGDHPDCQEGPPISIDWEPFQSKFISVEKFESKRAGRRRTSEHDLFIDPLVREQYLKSRANVTDKDIIRVRRMIRPIQQQRERNARMRQAFLSPSESKLITTFKDIVTIG